MKISSHRYLSLNSHFLHHLTEYFSTGILVLIFRVLLFRFSLPSRSCCWRFPISHLCSAPLSRTSICHSFRVNFKVTSSQVSDTVSTIPCFLLSSCDLSSYRKRNCYNWRPTWYLSSQKKHAQIMKEKNEHFLLFLACTWYIFMVQLVQLRNEF